MTRHECRSATAVTMSSNEVSMKSPTALYEVVAVYELVALSRYLLAM
jgi:hypothetical protein